MSASTKNILTLKEFTRKGMKLYSPNCFEIQKESRTYFTRYFKFQSE
jgi:hypothetical protein